MSSEELEALVAELEGVAARLRSGALPSPEAAELVERCAELASRLGAELDARSREADDIQGQERLL